VRTFKVGVLLKIEGDNQVMVDAGSFQHQDNAQDASDTLESDLARLLEAEFTSGGTGAELVALLGIENARVVLWQDQTVDGQIIRA
jgi:hypothetical protein